MRDVSKTRTVLVTGATGYIGGRLVPRLLEAGYRVRVYVRSPEKLTDTPWSDAVDIIQGDLDDGPGLTEALTGCETLYYLVHSMGSGGDFESKERIMAKVAAFAAEQAGVSRIIFLGGLHPDGVQLSKHMRSRETVARAFLDSSVNSVVFRAGVIIGSGSASFEMIRHLAERLPVMIAPSWVKNFIEPIAIRDVLGYLVAAADLPGDINREFDLGSGEVMSYSELMNQYCDVAKLPRRKILVVPVPAKKIAGLWVGLVTPIPLGLALPLVESLQHNAVSGEHDIDQYIPKARDGLLSYREAVRLALGKISASEIETTWASASNIDTVASPLPNDPEWAGRKVFVDERYFKTPVDTEYLWQVIEGIGGKNGWYSFPLAWTVRGWMDKLSGGNGLVRGRRDPARLRVGEAVDWWRVEKIESGRLLLLRAELGLPGKAWLELEVMQGDDAENVYRQRAIFFPRGLAGRLYWYVILPFHAVIFAAMGRNITKAAARLSTQ